MLNISKYLEKFKKNIEKGEYLIESIAEVVKKNTQIIIDVNTIQVKENVIYIKDSPLIKNKIFIHKEDILLEINKISSIKYVDIR
ncbi:MAG TPA: hypothetical protein PLZ99_02370 [Parcubacteria group bacterium]|jgi:hypothetical protein|nr:hypothetical protein [Parcubacteria group bacterium]